MTKSSSYWMNMKNNTISKRRKAIPRRVWLFVVFVVSVLPPNEFDLLRCENTRRRCPRWPVHCERWIISLAEPAKGA